MPALKNFTWYSGEDLTFDVYYAVDGIAQDLTNYAVRMDIARLDSQGAPLAAVVSLNSTDFDGDLDEPGQGDNEIAVDANGRIHVRISRALTLGTLRVAGREEVFAYDLFLRNNETNEQKPLLFGNITLTRAVTQWQ